MANQIYANSMEVSCKAASGKSICAFPDVCMTPPPPPGLPVPYPNTGLASDCTDGSRSVKISRKEVMLKNKSYFKRSTGDEAGIAPKKGVLTSKIMGKVYFKAWSMNVKFEGENVVRHLDITTHNHASEPGNSPPMVHFDEMHIEVPEACRNEANAANEACEGNAKKRPMKEVTSRHGNKRTEHDGRDCTPECKAKQKCILVPKGKSKQACCHPDLTGDHIIEDHWIWEQKGETLMPDLAHLKDKPDGPYDGAPTMCANASRFKRIHGVGHGTRGLLENAEISKPGDFTYARAKEISLIGHEDQCAHAQRQTGTSPNCSKACTEAQLDDFYGKDGKKRLKKPHRRQALTKVQKAEAQARAANRARPPVRRSVRRA
jgi:hypothetical protein